MTRKVVLSPEAEADLVNIYDYIAARSGGEVAIGYYQRISDYCSGFAEFAERGMLRDDLRPGLRMIGFEKRVVLTFHVEEDAVVFERILYGGRDWESVFSRRPDI